MTPAPKFRVLKQQMRGLLASGNWQRILAFTEALPPRRAVNPLFAFLHDADSKIKWPAVMLMGAVVARLGDARPEEARVIVRRLLWNLNDESGGIGWGAAEALGEIMARSRLLAQEYAHLLIALIRPEAGIIEKVELLEGILWGLGRLAHARPDLTSDLALLLPSFLQSANAPCRAMAAWIAAAVPHSENRPLIQNLLSDDTDVQLFQGNILQSIKISALATEALTIHEATTQQEKT